MAAWDNDYCVGAKWGDKTLREVESQHTRVQFVSNVTAYFAIWKKMGAWKYQKVVMTSKAEPR